MQLPAGWRITYASKGMVDASGPQGGVSLGTWCQVFTPQGAAQMYMRPPLVIPYGDPAVAARQMTTALNAQPGQAGRVRWLRLIEKKPTPWVLLPPTYLSDSLLTSPSANDVTLAGMP